MKPRKNGCWGTVWDADDAFVHVVPVDDDGFVMSPHVLTLACPCQPCRAADSERVLVHEMVH